MNRRANIAVLAAALVLIPACSTAPTTTGGPAGAGDPAAPTTTLDRFAKPADGILTGGRITADDLPALRAAGIRHVIDLTPDAETPGFDEAAAVRAAGLAYDNLPIAGAGELDHVSVAAFDQLLRKVEGPTLVHCASGNRVGALVALRASWLQGADDEAAIAEGRRWGLRSLEGEVRNRLERARCAASAQGRDESGACASAN